MPQDTVAEGLQKVQSDVPVRHGFVEAGAAVTRLTGAEAWLEAGVKPVSGFALFARAFVNPLDAGAMIGGRWEF